jgi:hypothetical protein
MHQRNKLTFAITSAMMCLHDEADVMRLNDKLSVPTEREFKATGQMIAPCIIARTGTMQYKAKRLSPLFDHLDPESMVTVGTSEAELFSQATIDSARSAPITMGHPSADVSTENANELMKGHLEGAPTRLGDELSGIVVLNDADTIAIVKAMKDELSIGQDCKLVLADAGDEMGGVPVQAWKTNIVINHVAIVPKGRAGTAKIADTAEEYLDAETLTAVQIAAKHEVPLKDIEEALEKGIKVEMEHTTRRAVASIIARDHLAESADYYVHLKDEVSLQDSVDGLQASVDTLTEKNEALTTSLADANEKLENRPEVEPALVINITTTLLQAKLLDSAIEYTGQSMAELKRQAVGVAYQGRQKLEDKSDAYIECKFDDLLEDALEDTNISDIQEVLNQQLLVKDETEEPSKAEQSKAKMVLRHAHKES